MAHATSNTSVAPGDPVLVAENIKTITLQLLTNGPVVIYVGPNAPMPDPAGWAGPVLTKRGLSAISFFSLDPAVDKVYATTVDGDHEKLAAVKSS